jgi:hypothetical protein
MSAIITIWLPFMLLTCLLLWDLHLWELEDNKKEAKEKACRRFN